MKTTAQILRFFEKGDYAIIKEQARARKIRINALAKKCGYNYAQFKRILDGKYEGTELAQKLLSMGYELVERKGDFERLV